MSEFKMPSLGADMDVGTLVEWVKHTGDTLQRGDIIAVVETQKGAIEIEVFEDGVLGEIKVQPGEEVPVGTVLALIEPKGSSPAAAPRNEEAAEAGLMPEEATEQETKPETPLVAAHANPTPHPPPSTMGMAPPRVTPAARRAAEEKGIDLAVVSPGPSGIIGLEEVEAAARKSPAGAARVEEEAPAARVEEAAPPPQRPTTKGIDLVAMRKAIAAAMTKSHREIPHYWVGQTIDLTLLFEWLQAHNRKRSVPERFLFAVPLIKAVAIALEDVPALNGHYVDDEFRPSDAVNVGVATALRGGGLIAPALLDVDRSSLDQIRDGLNDLVKRARAGRLRSSEMTGGTITLSSLGEDTSDSITSLIYPPQVAIVGCGAPVERPHVVDGEIKIRRVMNVTVAGDHRVSDGRRASQFLVRLARTLETLEGLA